MKVTGYRFQHAIRELTHLRDVLTSQFGDNIMQFPSMESKLNIDEVAQKLQKVEKDIAALQEQQARYNLQVQVEVLGQSISLMQAVKTVGGAGRIEKMWRTVAKGGTSKRSYRYSEGERDRNTEYAVVSVPVEMAVERAREAHRYATALREAIQLGNATTIDVEGLEPGLFDP
jgi:hypothetical protein